jgi:NAD(P)-dependent dehydrogenase (short-subunit alcohol dehydrogenase family)
MAFEFPRYGVRVNGLRFGAAETEAFGHVPNAHAALANIARVSPMGRNVNVDDVASFVSLLADDRARFLNGSIIPFDGGETAAYAVQMLETPNATAAARGA